VANGLFCCAQSMAPVFRGFFLTGRITSLARLNVI
jgi:hypothetical protein